MKIDLGTYIQGSGEGIRQYMREEQFSNERLNKQKKATLGFHSLIYW